MLQAKNIRKSKPARYSKCREFHKVTIFPVAMKSIGEIEENLAIKAEPVLGFKPSSKIKRGPIGIIISIICIAIVIRELSQLM